MSKGARTKKKSEGVDREKVRERKRRKRESQRESERGSEFE